MASGYPNKGILHYANFLGLLFQWHFKTTGLGFYRNLYEFKKTWFEKKAREIVITTALCNN